MDGYGNFAVVQLLERVVWRLAGELMDCHLSKDLLRTTGWERHFRPRLWRQDLHYTVMIAHIDCGTSLHKLSKSETEDGYNNASPGIHSCNLADSSFTWLLYDFCWIDRGCILGIPLTFLCFRYRQCCHWGGTSSSWLLPSLADGQAT
jgi:hypothetical protein